MTDERTYLLGMAPDEVRRLAQQHDAWRVQTERVWDLAGIDAGATVVDLGCGPGFTTLDLARRVGPAGRVIAVDVSATALHELTVAADRAGVENLVVVEGFEAEIDLGAYAPDVVFARWLYWFLPEADESVARVAGALRPGARFAVMDYCNYLGIGTEPRAPGFDRVFGAVYRSVIDAGGSLDIAGRLPALFRAVGLRTTHVEPLDQVARPGEPVWEWVSTFQRLHLPALVDRGYLAAGELAAHEAWWMTLAGNPDAVFFAPPVLGVVGVKECRGQGTEDRV
ncbi:MAG TPA: methyltransferase domain-containing protein [Vicinamibacterales bacterium]|nr:methyltransferase domain-containing protein [Vicinamibacterales bacterium]